MFLILFVLSEVEGQVQLHHGIGPLQSCYNYGIGPP